MRRGSRGSGRNGEIASKGKLQEGSMERSSSRSAGPRPRDWRDVEQVDAAVAMVHSQFATCVAWIASARGMPAG